jgi:hypothetical protein
VKYLFKYTFKGPDRACVEQGRDEVSEFVEGRSVGSPEAAWRLLEYPLHGKSHVVERLPVHDDVSKLVAFQPDHAREAFEKALAESDKLEAWFQWNRDAAALKNVSERERRLSWRYVDMPTHCAWNQKTHAWQLRGRAARRGEVVTRLFAVHPGDGTVEAYYLRLLLLHVPGSRALQWDDLRCMGPDEVKPTFRALAGRLGLLHDDVETQTMLEEAVQQRKDTDLLCALFADCLVWLEVQDPPGLWRSFVKAVALHHRAHSELDLWMRVNNVLDAHGKSCEHYRVARPEEVAEGSTSGPSSNVLDAEHVTDESALREERCLAESFALNPEQKAVYEAIKANAEQRDYLREPMDVLDLPNVFYVDGPAGTGKTDLYHSVFHLVRSLGLIVLCVASSGIASLLLPRGRTSHSRFGLPVPVPLDECVCHVTRESDRGQLLRKLSAVIWDEAPTSPLAVWNAVDKLFRDIRAMATTRNEHRPFGGVLMLLGGDFRQTMPVLPRVPPENVIDYTLVRTPWWRHPDTMRVHVLRRNMRARGDPRFAAELLAVGEGRVASSNEKTVGMSLRLRDNVIPLPSGVTAPASWTVEDLLTWVYTGHADLELAALPDFYAERLVLTPLNVHTQRLNDIMLSRLDVNTERVYWSTDTAMSETEAEEGTCPMEFLHSLEASGLPSHELRIRVGSVLILLRNFAPRRGLCNGTRVLALHQAEHRRARHHR